LQCLAVDNNDITSNERNSRVNSDGAVNPGIYREGTDMLGSLLVGDVEDHHPGALPRAVGTTRDHVSTATETEAVLAAEGGDRW
jgi:hypothetical protein